MVIHLNTHSCYSLLEGLPLPVELATAAKSFGMPAQALTDHNYLTGSVEFYQACIDIGIQPILGLEVDLAWPESTRRLTLLAMDLTGWANLCRISSSLLIRPEPIPPCRLDLLAVYSQGLIALSDDQGDPNGKRLQQLAEIFPERIYLSLSDQNTPLADLYVRLGIPRVALWPAYYLSPHQAAMQRLVTAIRLNTPLTSLPPHAAVPAGAYMLSPTEMQARFNNLPEALAATQEIAERCQVKLPLGQPHLPQVQVPTGMNPTEYLRQQAMKGAKQLYGNITEEIQSRLDHELDVIAERGFEPIFLIVQELLDFAHRKDIPTASRGSASSSLVAHCLGITTPDTLALDLYFERFLNPARTTPPDIDIDIDSGGRDEVIQHAFDAFGSKRVAMVGTINRFRPRSALADAAKAHGLLPGRIRELAKQLPYGFWARMEAADENKVPESPYLELRKAHPSDASLFDAAEALLKLPRHLSVHPGGLVIAPGELTELVPVMRSGSKGITITQLDLGSVEALGLVKIDLLGIRGLTVLGQVAGDIQSWRSTEYSSRLQVLDFIPNEDPQTADVVENGRTIGCFQIESPGMRGLLRELHARRPQDIIAVLALFRPGPMQGGLKDAFVRRYRGEEAVSHLHPALGPLLKDTFGVILYQEQVLRIAHALAGLSLAEADLLRRAMSHFDPGRQMQQLKEKFIAQAEERSGVPKETGERIWDMMAAFAGYGFPKAHAASYAQVAWRSAWCKTHFPAEFMAAVLANWGGYYPQRVYISEVRRLKIPIHPPHINHSQRPFAVSYAGEVPELYMGLDQVRDLTQRTQERILRGRPFSSVEDFLLKVDPRRQEAENLTVVGALDGLGSIPSILQRIHTAGQRAGQMSLFPSENTLKEEWSLERSVTAQQEILGISLETRTLELAAAQAVRLGAVTTLEAIGRVGQRVSLAAIRQNSRRSRTARGEWMMFLVLEDLEGVLDAVIFPDVYRRVKDTLSTQSALEPIWVSGVMEREEGRLDPLLRIDKVGKIDPDGVNR